MTGRFPVQLRIALAMLVVGGGLIAVALGHASGSSGGTFRIVLGTDDVPNVDPAFAGNWALLDPTCARLMAYPDRPAPDGLRLAPEVAAAYPRISRDGKTYTFTLRNGFRFSDGTPVAPGAFAHAIERMLAPGIESSGVFYVQNIVGAAAFHAGKSTAIRGLDAAGNRLVVRFNRPSPDFVAQTTMPYFCAVPPSLPSDPEGVSVFPGAGPYYVSEFVRGRSVVLERNTFYRGSRPHHLDRFVVDLVSASPQQMLARVERGTADWTAVGPLALYFDAAVGLVRKYGVNRSQFFVTPGLALRYYALNVARPLFRDNLALRRAVNFAVDRPAIVRQGGLASPLLGRPTDQYLPPTMPGFRDAHVYPLDGPDLRKARALARGHTGSGKAILGTINVPPALAAAQVVKQNLEKIGLDVEIRALPPGAYFQQAGLPKAPFDLALGLWVGDYVDPSEYVSALFDSRFIGSNNLAHFDVPEYNTLMRSAGLRQGDARYSAYGRLDVRLARDAAPAIAVDFDNVPTLVSKRVGCVVIQPVLFGLDLTTACLK